MIGLGSSIAKPGKIGKRIVRDGLVLKHDYNAGAVQPCSTGAVKLDGTSDYINCGNGGSLQIGDADTTYTAWVRSNGGSSEYIISKRDSSGGAQSLFLNSAHKL